MTTNVDKIYLRSNFICINNLSFLLSKKKIVILELPWRKMRCAILSSHALFFLFVYYYHSSVASIASTTLVLKERDQPIKIKVEI